MGIKNYTINKDLTVDVDVDGWVVLAKKNLLDIPVQFGVVRNDFLIYDNNLTTLRGCPNEVYGRFHCADNKLKDLKFSPNIVSGAFWITDNPLTSLEGYSIYNLKKHINEIWFIKISNNLKEDYFDKMLEEYPEIFSLIDFKTTK